MNKPIKGKFSIKQQDFNEETVPNANDYLENEIEFTNIDSQHFPELRESKSNSKMKQLVFKLNYVYLMHSNNNRRQNLRQLFDYFVEACKYLNPCYAAVRTSQITETGFEKLNCKPQTVWRMNYVRNKYRDKVEYSISDSETLFTQETSEGVCWVRKNKEPSTLESRE